MNIIKLISPVLIILMLILTGCSVTGFTHKAPLVKAADSPDKVREILGNPGRVEHQNDFIKWYYKSDERLTIYFFENKKLTVVYNREY
jgi:outer membrane protein assembly factor BamE (lipoprotein component of BamABCDE complex)